MTSTAHKDLAEPPQAAAPRFGRHVLALDCRAEARRIEDAIRALVRRLQRRGAVLGVSGGVDSALCAVLAARALGPRNVRALLLPERSTSADSTDRGRRLCEAIGVAYEVEDLEPALTALGCYRRAEAAVRRLFPAHRPGDRFKIAVAEDVLGSDRLTTFTLVVEDASGARSALRMPHDVYLEVVAATNMKQRARKLVEYHHAERLNHAVIGTPNRLEFDLGFFVRGGDGLADVKPIAHLYKTQVFALAAHLGVPQEILDQPPSTDTYGLPQTQEEFYFAHPYGRMDLLLFAWHQGVPPAEVGDVLGLSGVDVERAFRDIEAKRRAAAKLHRSALLVEDAHREGSGA